MTLYYYDMVTPFVNFIQQWYYKQFSVKISKKHAILFAIGSIQEIPDTMLVTVSRLHMKFGDVKAIVVDGKMPGNMHVIRSMILKNTITSKTLAISTIIIAFAMKCQIKKHTFHYKGMLALNDTSMKSDMLDMQQRKHIIDL